MAPHNMFTIEDVERAAERAAKKVLFDMLVVMGVDASDPQAVIEMQKDFAHVRAWRTSVDEMRKKGLLTAVGIFVTFVSGAIWLALRGGHQ